MYKFERTRIAIRITGLLVGAAAVFATGCGGPDDPPPDPDFPPPPDGQGVQLVSTVHVEPGEEQLTCRYVVLPDAPIAIARFEHRYSPGSHHLLVYPTDLSPDAIDDATFDCRTRGDLHATGVLYGGSEPDAELAYPPGVAMKLPARSVVLLETHYLDATDAPLDAEARVNLWFAAGPVDTEAGTLFFRDWALYLPPAPAEASATMRCEIPADVSLLYATSHMHRRGLEFHARVTPPGGAPTSLHDSLTWSAPTPTVYWPPRSIAAGSTIEFSCDYRNDRTSAVIDGVSADTDEMCVLVGGYWPKQSADTELCLGDGSGPALTGTRTCAQTVSCMSDAGVGNWVGGQACIADTCAASAPALSSFVVCVNRNDCWGDAACVTSHCGAQWDGCAAAECP